MPDKVNSTPRGNWPKGMDNVTDLHDLDPDSVRDALNVDVNKAGMFRRRKGFELAAAGSWHSLYDHPKWPCFFGVVDGNLSAINLIPNADDYDFGVTTLATVDHERPVSFCEHNNKIHWSNGFDFGLINRNLSLASWGVPTPNNGYELVAVSNGGLPAGEYAVALTTLASTGEESAPTPARYVTVGAAGGIALTALAPPVASGDRLRIYLSPCNGDVLYHVVDLPHAATMTVLNTFTKSQQAKALETRYMERVAPYSNLRSHAGRVYWIEGDRVYYTEALNVGLYTPHKNYLWWGSQVTMFEPIEGGVFVGTEDQVLFLAGREPKTFDQTMLRNSGVVPGTARVISGSAFGPEGGQGLTATFWTSDGVFCRGDTGGAIIPITEGRLALPGYERGATIYRESNGIKQLLATMSRTSEGSGFGARDTAVAEVRRNGVLI